MRQGIGNKKSSTYAGLPAAFKPATEETFTIDLLLLPAPPPPATAPPPLVAFASVFSVGALIHSNSACIQFAKPVKFVEMVAPKLSIPRCSCQRTLTLG